MAVTVLAGALQGVEAIAIRVEVDLLRRLPRVCVVGLAAHEVKESAERVRSAITSAGLEFPRMRVVVNLAPADVRKDGTSLDLPIALGILAADGQIPADAIDGVLAVGELSLQGDLRPVRGAIPLAMLARKLGRTLILPEASAGQAAVVPGADVRGARTLTDVIEHLRAVATIPCATASSPVASAVDVVDLSDVRGQARARQALEIAAAGAHHLLMMGPPGCGKSMLARRLPTILPPLRFDEALEATCIHSAAGLLRDDPRLLAQRPFRAPHHTVTVAGLVGDARLRPGEVSLAHHGVLFLDEAAEFPRSVLEVLRTPLEDGAVRVSRALGSIEYPAALTLVMASNPCPCGRRGGPGRGCECKEDEIRRYRRRLSGPILDRIDLHVELESVPASQLVRDLPGESSAAVRERVLAARSRQDRRGQRVPNGRMLPAELDRHAAATSSALDLLHAGVDTHGLSARVAGRLLKVARTIADLAGSNAVDEPHVALALAFRPLEGLD